MAGAIISVLFCLDFELDEIRKGLEEMTLDILLDSNAIANYIREDLISSSSSSKGGFNLKMVLKKFVKFAPSLYKTYGLFSDDK